MTEPQDPWPQRPVPQRPPRPGPGEWYQKPVRSRGTEIFLKVLAAVAVVTVLGVVAAAVLFMWAMNSYASNK